MAWATLPWLRNFSAFSSALLLLKAMDDLCPPGPAHSGNVLQPTDGLDMKVSTRQKQGATRHKGGGAKGDNSASWVSGRPRTPAEPLNWPPHRSPNRTVTKKSGNPGTATPPRPGSHEGNTRLPPLLTIRPAVCRFKTRSENRMSGRHGCF